MSGKDFIEAHPPKRRFLMRLVEDGVQIRGPTGASDSCLCGDGASNSKIVTGVTTTTTITVDYATRPHH